MRSSSGWTHHSVKGWNGCSGSVDGVGIPRDRDTFRPHGMLGVVHVSSDRDWVFPRHGVALLVAGATQSGGIGTSFPYSAAA